MLTEARELKKEKNKLEKSLERKMKRNQKKQNVRRFYSMILRREED